MKNKLSLAVAATLLLITSLPQSVIAAPKVVVSIAPLHSLVSGLMEGVGEPVLLFNNSSEVGSGLSPAQKLHLVTADIVLWTGPGFEDSVAKSASEEIPAIGKNMFALTHHLPLLPLRNIDLDAVEHPEDRQAYRDLNFWLDPKLATMAARKIALKLAELDPDNLERYLENEISVVARLKGMHKELVETLSPLKGAFTADEALPVYLAWRFQLERKAWDTSPANAETMRIASQCRHLMHASNSAINDEKTGIYGDRLVPGKELYFRLMENQVSYLSRCVPELVAGN